MLKFSSYLSKDKLSMLTRGSSSVTDYLISIKRLANELTSLGAPLSDVELLLYKTQGLGLTYKELVAALRIRDTIVPFEKLFNKITNHETFLLCTETQHSDPIPPTTHFAKHSSYSSRGPKTHYSNTAACLLPTLQIDTLNP